MNKSKIYYDLVRRCVADAIHAHVERRLAGGSLHTAPTADEIEQIREEAVERLYAFTGGEHPSLQALSTVDGVLALALITPTQIANWRRNIVRLPPKEG